MVAPSATKAQITIAKPPQGANSAGILPVSTAGTKPKVTTGQSARHHPVGLKVNIRRLPPGLTEEEFKTALGDEWLLESKNIDWYSYIPGKVSKDPAKPSRPSRAYLHLSEAYLKEHPSEPLKELQAKTSPANFTDAKGTHTDSALLAPWPTVIESPYGRIPSNKVRKDNRQGTIDQDPEFIDFLQDLTNPLVKPTPIDVLSERDNKPEEKIVTPLVQYLRDKKANKAKEAKAAKQNKQDSKDGRASDKKSAKGTKDSEKKSFKAEKAAKEPIKLLNKKAAQSGEGKSGSKSSAAGSGTPSETTEKKPAAGDVAPKPEKKRERGSVAAAAKILQRDLGIGAGAGGRRRRDAGKGTKEISAEGTASTQTSSAPADGAPLSKDTTSATSAETAVAGPAASSGAQNASAGASSKGSAAAASTRSSKAHGHGKQSQPNKVVAAAAKASSTSTTPTSTPAAATPTAPATAAFLKHANASQGITETLLQSTFAGFGTVTKVEIDKKKGFAYVDFAEPAALQKAIAASPVKIAQGAVVVLERKTTTSQAKAARSEGRGGGGGGGGGGSGCRGGGDGSGGRGGGGSGGNAPATRGGGRGRGRGARQQASAAGADATGAGGATKPSEPAAAPAT